MVAQAPTTPLPTLSRPDKLRLTLYFSLGQSVEALALELQDIHRDHQARLKTNNPEPATFQEALTTENTALASYHSGLGTRDSALLSASPCHPLTPSPTHLPPPPDAYDLAAWTLSDPIAPHIAYRRAEHLEQRKQRAFQELDTILADAASSPIEKRRAATTMLRMLATQLSRNRVPSPASPAPGGRGARAAGGEGSVSTPPTHSASHNTPPTSPLTIEPALPQHSVLSTQHSAAPKPASLVLDFAGGIRSISINPQARPHPDLTPKDLIALALIALKTPTDRPTRNTLEHFLTPQATVNHEPILNLESQLTPLAPKLKVVQIFDDDHVKEDPGPPQSRTSTSSLVQPGRSNRFHITLTRADTGPHPNCWLIAAINPIKDSS